MILTKQLFRILVTIAIFALILRSIDVSEVWDTFNRASPALLLVALLLQFGSTTLSAYRWQLIMQNLQFGQLFFFYLRSYYKAIFFNQGLPTSIGGDAVRILDVANRGFRKRDALYGVMLDRVAGLAALLLMNLVAYSFDPDLLPGPIYKLTLLLVLGGIVGIAAILSLRYLPWLDAFPRLGILKTISNRLRQAFRRRRFMLAASSLLIPLSALLSFFAIGSSLGLQYDLVTYFIIVPPAILLTVIPISLAGWGVREGVLVALFSMIGAGKSAILAMSIIYGMMQIVVSLPGFIIYLQGRKHPL